MSGFVGVTGTLEGVNYQVVEAMTMLLAARNPEAVAHGCAIGVDEQFHLIARNLHIPVYGFPSNIEHKRMELNQDDFAYLHPEAEPLERNKSIINFCDLLIACPKSFTEERRSGTWATMRFARKQGKPGVVLVKNNIIPLDVILP